MKQPSSATFLMPLAGQPFANRFSRFRRRDSSGRGEVRGEPPSGADGHVQSAGERCESSSLVELCETRFLHRSFAGRTSGTIGNFQRGSSRLSSTVY